jgi:anaerobic glycerol-3-phosphate dehydrogenase
LRADEELRALDDQGRPASAAGAPLFACGAAIGGYDAASGDGGLGVAAVTGCEAGRRAAEAARC